MELFFLFIFLVISYAFGLRLFHILKARFSSLIEEAVFSVALGMGAIACIVFILGIIGIVSREILWGLFVLLLLFSFQELKEICKSTFNVFKNTLTSALYPLDILIFILVFIAFIMTLAGALAPPTGHDALSYRLAQVNIFAKTGKVAYIPYTRESLWPYLIEMLFMMGMILKSDILAKLIAWSFGAVSVGSVYMVAKTIFSQRAGYVAALICLLTPIMFTQMTYAYVDIPMALYSFLSLIALIKFLEEKNYKWALIAGIFTGFVLSIKYIGGIALVTLCIAAVYGLYREKFKLPDMIKGAISFFLALILISSWWYLRSYLHTGNPLYPFFADVFNGYGWKESLEANIGNDFSVFKFLKFPWDITMFPARFGGEHFGIVYLLFMPLLIFIDWKRKIPVFLLLYSILYTFIWFFIDKTVVRFLIPALLPMSVLMGAALYTAISKKNIFALFIKTVLIIVMLFNLGLVFYHNVDKIKTAIGYESKEDYLMRNERTYQMAGFIRNTLSPEATVLMVNEVRAYYLDRKYIHLRNLIEEEDISALTMQDPSFLDKLQDYGVDYIFYSKNENPRPWIRKLTNMKEPLYACSFVNKKGKAFQYELYSIK